MSDSSVTLRIPNPSSLLRTGYTNCSCQGRRCECCGNALERGYRYLEVYPHFLCWICSQAIVTNWLYNAPIASAKDEG